MKIFMYRIWQCTWEIFQTILGFVLFIKHYKNKQGFLMAKKRKEKQIPYGAFITEKWANRLGEYVTEEKSIGNLVIE